MRLANKIAIITGGGSGIGQATAYLFAKEGAKVVVAQRNSTKGEETVAVINAGDGEAIFVRTNVTNIFDVRNLVKVTMDKFRRIDILFNNAGKTSGKPIAIENTDEMLWDQVYAANVKGIFLVTKHVVPEIKKLGEGVIINTASLAGIRPRKGAASYSSSKGAVIMLTKALALELAPHNIRVNCINPGVTDTPMLRLVAEGMNWEEYRKSMESTTPLGRMVKPEEVAYAALYLASDESSMVTGSCINVDGGRGI